LAVKVYTTCYENGKALTSQKEGGFVCDSENQETNLVNIYPEIKYQDISGFGGAITEAVGATLLELPQNTADDVIKSYFSHEGLGFRFIRTHIDSCDFALRNYSAVEDESDTEFSNFSLKRDEKYIIPWIKKAYEAAGCQFPVMLSPWSPPAFMKTNGEKNNGGKLKKEFYPAWAKYFCRYIKEYRNKGINVSMISIQNEPNAEQTWDSCTYTPNEEKEFLRDFLYPELVNSGLGDIEIYIWDHNKERLYERTCAILDSETEHMVSGACFHWYSGDHFDSLRLVRERYPKLKLLFSEGCIEYSVYKTDNQLVNSDKYCHDIIGNLCAGMNTFIDWNIALNSDGGPNHVNNLCEAPIICDIKNKTWEKKLSFYYLGHFSRFIQPTAKRIGTSSFSTMIEVVGVENPDGSIAVVLYNRSNKEEEVFLRLNEKLLRLELPKSGIATAVISTAKG